MALFHAPPLGHDIGERLVGRGFLTRETDISRVDVILVGGHFRYTPAFWERVGALSRDPDGPGWTVGVRTPEAQTEVRARFAEEWQAAGAPAIWTRMEAEAALEALLITTPSPSWSEAPR